MSTHHADLSSKATKAQIVSGELGHRVEAWRYKYARYSEVFVQVESLDGKWSTIRVKVPHEERPR
jgi:hypothetical protein